MRQSVPSVAPYVRDVLILPNVFLCKDLDSKSTKRYRKPAELVPFVCVVDFVVFVVVLIAVVVVVVGVRVTGPLR